MEEVSEEASGDAGRACSVGLWAAGSDHSSAVGAEVDNVVGVGDHVEVVLDDDQGRAGGKRPVEYAQQSADVEWV